MIQKYIKDLLERELPGLEWTIEHYTGKSNTGTVLGNTPSTSDPTDERGFIYPSYQVYIRSSDYPKAEFLALRVSEILNKRVGDIATREYISEKGELLGSRSYTIFFIECDPPLRIGVEGNNLDYSINFRTILKEAK